MQPSTDTLHHRMGGLTSNLARLGAMPPLLLGMLFGVPIAFGRALQIHGLRVMRGDLVTLGTSLVVGIGALLWFVVTWFRDDDALEAGALVGMSVGGGMLVAGIVLARHARPAFVDAVWDVLASQVDELATLVVLVPVCSALVWIARRISAALGWRFEGE